MYVSGAPVGNSEMLHILFQTSSKGTRQSFAVTDVELVHKTCVTTRCLRKIKSSFFWPQADFGFTASLMRVQLSCCCRRASDAKQEHEELWKCCKELFYTYLREVTISYV